MTQLSHPRKNQSRSLREKSSSLKNWSGNSKKGSKAVKLFDPDPIVATIVSDCLWDLKQARVLHGLKSDFHKYYLSNQRKCITKKYASLNSKGGTKAIRAMDLFRDVNEHMSHFSTKGQLILPDISKRDGDPYSQVLRTARGIIYNILKPLDEDEWYLLCRNSTGASQGVSFFDTSIEAKFTYPISGSVRVKPLVDRYLSFDLQLKEAIVNHNSSRGTQAPEYLFSNGSRATTVPKDDKIDRLIAIEPTWNMYFQQGLMSAMYLRLASYGLDVRTLPDKHKELAREASICGGNSTIDFSSASDCLSYDLVKWLIPPTWFHRLDQVRSKYMNLNGELIKLHMFSTMGNAVTFPLETLIFYSLAVASTYHSRRKLKFNFSCLEDESSRRSCSVFGDDCIVPTFATPLFLQVCKKVGFLVNEEKTFSTSNGGFRESCGGDYLHGMDVRAFYLKPPTSTRLSALEPWLYVSYNKLLKKYFQYFGSLTYLYDKRALKLLEKLFVHYGFYLKVVPDDFPDDAGLKIGHDFGRFLACYPGFRCSEIAVDKHGTYEFRYCRFVYRSTKLTSYQLRYATWLKSSTTPKPVFRFLSEASRVKSRYRVKGSGGYVVAKTKTSFWSFCNLNAT